MRKSLSQLFNEYLKEREMVSRLSPETLRGFKQSFRLFHILMPEINDLNSLSTEVITEFFSRLTHRVRIVGRTANKKGIKSSTIKTYWSKLNSFFDWLVARNYFAVNLIKKIKPPQVVFNDHRALKNDEVHKILSSITLHSKNSFLKSRDLLIVQLLLFCGIRRRELLLLETRDVDMEKRIVTIRGETSKSKRTRQIPIHPALWMQLQEYIVERKRTNFKTQFLLISSTADKGLTIHGLKHWVEKLKFLSGVNFHVHRFRHTFACNLAKQNTNTIKLQRLLGHTDLRMTERYLRSLTVEDLRDDINKMDINI